MSSQTTRSGRPKFTPPASKADMIVEAVALIGFLLNIAFVIYGVFNLPVNIPTHVGPSGGIDSYGSKWALLSVFSIGAVFLYALLTIANRYPYIFNYPTIVTEENAPRLYSLARSMMCWLKAIMAWMFAVTAWWFIMILPYNPSQSGSSLLLMLPFIIAMAIVLGYSVIKLVQGSKPNTI